MLTDRRSRGRDDTAAGGRPPFHPAELLPIVRAALTRGEGPAAVLAWVRTIRERFPRPRWTRADEARARALARRLADRLNDRGGGDTVVE